MISPFRHRLMEARRAKPKYFPGKHIMHANLNAASGDLGKRIKAVVEKDIYNNLDNIFKDVFGRNMKSEYVNGYNNSYFIIYEPESIGEWYEKWSETFFGKFMEKLEEVEIQVPNRRVKSKDFNTMEHEARREIGADARVWWGALEATKRILSDYNWDEDDLWYDADDELRTIGVRLPLKDQEKYDLHMSDD